MHSLVGSLKEYLLDNINSRGFLESNIWNGNLIRAIVLQALDKKDGTTLRQMWKFIHAYILLKKKLKQLIIENKIMISLSK